MGRTRRGARGRAIAAMAAGAAVLLFGVSSAPAASAPTLGRAHAPSERGFGAVRPRTIYLGGDPTGLVEHISWSSWGRPQALGTGIADFVWPGQSVAGGSVLAPAKIVAYDLRSCHGRRAYLKVTWYFPEYGQSFEPSEYQGTCSDSVPSFHYTPPTECGPTPVSSPKGYADQVSAQGISCTAALALVAGSPAVSYLHTGGRFESGGLFCGSEGYNPELSEPPVSFECARGRVSIRFALAL